MGFPPGNHGYGGTQGASLGSSGQAVGPGQEVVTAEGIQLSHSTPQFPTSFSPEGQKGGGGGRGVQGGERGRTTSQTNYIQTTGNLLSPHGESTSVGEGWSL